MAAFQGLWARIGDEPTVQVGYMDTTDGTTAHMSQGLHGVDGCDGL
jgi:hypothetical protein